MKALTDKQALHKAAALCSRSERCAFEIRQKLQQWAVNEDDIEKILAHLYNQNFLNDERYAHAFVSDKFKFNKWGKIKIAVQLRQKQLSDKDINRALETINISDYRKLLQDLLADKKRKIKETDKLKLKAKLIRFAVSRGFESDEIFRALDAISLQT